MSVSCTCVTKERVVKHWLYVNMNGDLFVLGIVKLWHCASVSYAAFDMSHECAGACICLLIFLVLIYKVTVVVVCDRKINFLG